MDTYTGSVLMNKENFELFLRKTRFSTKLLVEIWDDLSTLERIDLIMHLKALPKELMEKAIEDSNSVVRMVAIKNGNIYEDDEPELYEKLKANKSPFLKAAMHAGSFFSWKFDFNALRNLSHFERLGIIALSDSIDATSFAKFIVEGLNNKLISEKEAAELVIEFVRNPNIHYGIEREPIDGLDWYTITENFEAIWNLTTCTPEIVHLIIAEEYPLETADNDSIPFRMTEQMPQLTLKTLVWRGYKPLLKNIEENPESFSEEVRESAISFAEFDKNMEMQEHLEEDDLALELKEFRSEINERLDSMFDKIGELLSRRRGLFG